PPENLSIPQSHPDLPPPQPLSAEALATTQPSEDRTPPALPTTRVPRPKPNIPAASPKPENTAPAPTAAAPTETTAIRQIVSPGEEQRNKQLADDFRRETQQRLAMVPASVQRSRKETVDHISNFLRQSQDAESHRDMKQAAVLAEKALNLARGLTGG